MNIFSRIFAYPILERELLNRLADRDAQIISLKVENQELRDRLYLARGLPPSGTDVKALPGLPVPYRTGRQRLRDLVTPKIATELSAEEEAQIRDSLTQ